MFPLRFLVRAIVLPSLAIAHPLTSAASASAFEYLISFGDSYSQTGFSITGTKPSAANPIGNPTFPGYTTTNGDNWIDFLITQYNTSLILSYNFAYGGATTDASLVAPYESTVLSLIDQVSQFSTNIASKPSYAPWTSSNALFATWMGVNDVGNAWSNSSWPTLSQEIIDRYFSQMQILYNAGARNFLFLTVPPIQKTPLVLAESTAVQTQEGAAVVTYNQLLQVGVDAFKKNNTGITAYVYDTTTPFNTAIDNPTAYGAPDATCYNGDGVSCLWFNNYHPGQAIHKLVAAGIAGVVPL
ncbi:related to cellulose-binding GDSL lipase/acylhydrolase [Phialocephala subalpina]|uniref:Related to cellulose-binding GDSL lipase/acylhydrolase n=1 Tax=Phialocephala subalpina TaxID=576137 RepID=A0A1L7WBW9_9HELO|nr:related to cellulose-binding GDSL lipase/acylhydrolase [Phialocephala subalpina]